MYPTTRTKTDYSTYYSTPHASFAWRSHSHRWLRPLMWVGLGFMIGILYSKVLLVSNHETIALASHEATEDSPKVEAQDKVTKSSKV